MKASILSVSLILSLNASATDWAPYTAYYDDECGFYTRGHNSCPPRSSPYKQSLTGTQECTHVDSPPGQPIPGITKHYVCLANNNPCDPPSVWNQAQQQCVAKNSNRASSSCATLNPVNIATGNKFFSVIDYTDATNSLLTIRRTYDSSDGEWFFNLGGNIIDVEENLYVTDELGATTSFILEGGHWRSEMPSHKSLERLNEGWLYRDGVVTRTFDESRRLVQLKNTQGEVVDISYQEDKSIATLSTASNAFDVHYRVHLSRVERIVFNDGSEIDYVYSEADESRLLEVNNLGHITQFLYDDINHPKAITSVVGADGKTYKSIEYHENGKVKSSSLAGDSAKDLFSYPAEGVVTTTNSLGKQTTYFFVDYFGAKKIRKVEGHATENCLAANKLYEYSDTGLLKTQTDWQGRITRFEYNTRGLETKRIEAEGTPEERIFVTEWHNDFNVKIKEITPIVERVYAYDSEGRLVSSSSQPKVGQ